MVGLKPLSHCWPGKVTSFSKTPEGTVQEVQPKHPAVNRNKSNFFNETRLYNNSAFFKLPDASCPQSSPAKVATEEQRGTTLLRRYQSLAVGGKCAFLNLAHFPQTRIHSKPVLSLLRANLSSKRRSAEECCR